MRLRSVGWRIRLAALFAAVAGWAVWTRTGPELPAVLQMAPFDQLEGVELGMRARRLVQARPRVEVAGYVGYQERLGPYSVTYAFPGSWSEEQPPPGRARLQRVVAQWELPGSEAARGTWHARQPELTRRLSVAPTCHRVRWPNAEAWLAVWRTSAADVFLLGQPAITMPQYSTPAAVRLGVTGRGNAVDEALGTATRVECGDSTLLASERSVAADGPSSIMMMRLAAGVLAGPLRAHGVR